MDWNAIGAIGELVGAAAVVASLVYLSMQIRHNSRQVQAQVRALEAESLTAIETAFSRFRLSIVENPQVASLWRRSLESFEELSDDEKTQAEVLFQEFCWAWQTTVTRMTRGDYSDVEPYLKNLLHVLNKPGARQWWGAGKREFADEFVSLVDRKLLVEG